MNAERRRRVHLALTVAWIGPGAAFCWWLRDSVAWVSLMSWYAIVVSHVAAWSAETPVEVEGKEGR